MKENIAIIGAGNMGASLLGGLIANKVAPQHIWIADPNTDKLTQLKNQWHVNVTEKNTLALQKADAVVLAVKPNLIAEVAQEIAPLIQEKKILVISVAAGVREEKLTQWLGTETAIVRCMPNTPALIRCGAAALHANAQVTAEQRNLAESILRAVGIAIWISDEKQMDAITALSGSGPAYFFLLIEILQEVGEKLGLPRETAALLCLQTALGSARMALETTDSAAELRKKVTSPGGTTAAALSILEQGNIRELFTHALQAATKRSRELS